MKVLLRSQSNFIPLLLVYGRLAYGDTKGRSISIADRAAGRKSVELALICVINQLLDSGEHTRVAANVSQCDNLKSVCSNNVKTTHMLTQNHSTLTLKLPGAETITLKQ